MDNGNPVIQPTAPAQNNIPDDIVNELPMNNNAFDDVNPAGAPPPPGGVVSPDPTTSSPDPTGPEPTDMFADLPSTGSDQPVPPPPPASDTGLSETVGGPTADVPPPAEPNLAMPVNGPTADVPPPPPTPPVPPADPIGQSDILVDINASSPAPAEPPALDPITPEPPAAPSVSVPINDSAPDDSSAPAPATPTVAPSDTQTTDLLDVKKNALQELSPLVEHIDQKPSEHFKTLLDMIRASDDASLVRPAYQAAQAIPDEAERAKALLEVVKEVNYLTQAKDEDAPPPPAS